MRTWAHALEKVGALQLQSKVAEGVVAGRTLQFRASLDDL